jgi:uracil-DNA glycosylase family 4
MAMGALTTENRFSPACRRCERLAGFLDCVRREHPSYYARPVPSFGGHDASLLVVGLAPGLHGANRTGRPFTGDHAGLLLYRTLHDYGFSSAPKSLNVTDGLRLQGCRITNAVRCLPPQNKPTISEVRTCNAYLRAELDTLPHGAAVLALGNVAHTAVLMALDVTRARLPFGHGSRHALPGGRRLFDSYHCSRYNTRTGRLTEAMFNRVFAEIRRYLDHHGPQAAATI